MAVCVQRIILPPSTPSTWWKMNCDWKVLASWQCNSSLFFPTTLPNPLTEPPASWQDKMQTIPEKKKKKKSNPCFENFWEQFAVWRMLQAAAYKSPLTSEDMSGMISGTLLPPQHFSSLNSNGWEMPEWRAGFYGPSRKALGRRPRCPWWRRTQLSTKHPSSKNIRVLGGIKIVSKDKPI